MGHPVEEAASRMGYPVEDGYRVEDGTRHLRMGHRFLMMGGQRGEFLLQQHAALGGMMALLSLIVNQAA